MKAIAVGSARKGHAERFGRELAEAMRTRGVGRRTLSAATGISQSSILNYRAGTNLPRHETAIALADSLGWPKLEDLSQEARTGRCVVDGRSFLNEGGAPKIYCSTGCQDVAQKMKGDTPRRVLAVRFERRLAVIQQAVEAFCRSCQPGGYCKDSACELRGVSPLPYQSSERVVRPAVPRPNVTPVTLEKQSANSTAAWAALTPEQRTARVAAARSGRWAGRASA